MAEVVNAGTGERLFGRSAVLGVVVGPDGLGHEPADRVGVDRLTPSGREHVIVFRAAPVFTNEELVSGLPPVVFAQHCDSVRVDGDGPGSAALGGPLDAFARDDSSGAHDLNAAGVEIDVGPTEVEQLAAPRTGVCGQTVKGVEAMRTNRLKKDPKLRRRPDPARFVQRCLGPFRPLHGVAGQQLVNNDGIMERFPKDGVKTSDRGDGQLSTALAAGREKVAVELADLCGAYGLESNSADVRLDVELDHAAVAVERPGLDLDRVSVEPLVEISGDRDRVPVNVFIPGRVRLVRQACGRRPRDPTARPSRRLPRPAHSQGPDSPLARRPNHRRLREVAGNRHIRPAG